MRPRTALALGLAGLATGGLGATVLPATADVRTFELTLKGGKVVTVSVDAAPDADLWDLRFPGVDPAAIEAIAEVDTPAPVTGATPPAAPSEPAPPAETTPAAGAQGQPDAPKPATGEEPEAGKGERQKTTGKKPRKAREKAEEAAGDLAAAPVVRPRPEPRRSSQPGEAGLPTAANPTTSIAIPGAAPIGVPNFFIDKFRIPPFLLSIYQAAGMEYGIRWEVLAAINEIETDYGRNLNVSSAGALGWMQFMPATWKAYGTDANGDGKKDPYNPVDAIFSAARYLRAAGAEEDLRKAIFAYNHADWYVDSVLMRARLIGGLPSNLVGSLTGLTQGMFPVAAKSRYADDLDEREAERRIAKGRNAAVPVESDADRRGINIYARPGSRVVATQDGKVVGMGSSARLGRYVRLRDAFGNTYTYAHLKTVADRHPVPRDAGRSEATPELPPADPRPTTPASAGKQPPAARAKGKAERASAARPQPAAAPAVEKERLFAHPSRPAAYQAGGEDQLRGEARPSDLAMLDLPADQVEMKRLKVGSRVVGGTVLGRIGRTSRTEAPHMLFEIRPAGRGAPRIDPKPILDGWKLLESTAIYRAQGRNALVGPDAKTPSIGQILLMGKSELEERVLKNPRVEIYGCGRRDIRGARIDRRVLATLEFLAASGLRPTVTSLQCGHSTFTASGNISHHSSGNAVDIARVNGVPILGNQGKGSVTDITVRRLLTLQGTMKPAQIISLMKYDGSDNTVAMADHADHIHVGFTPYFDSDSAAGRQLGAQLKPGQWIKLIDRLGQIDNPTVRVAPSKDAITVKPGRASRRHQGD
jgi:murein DD-endopeptidase MepM/ murein hydrolase activator NlpD